MSEKEKQKTWREKQARLAHSIVEQITADEHITYAGAFEVLELAKARLRYQMESTRAIAPTEIRDIYFCKIESPGADTPGNSQH